MFTRKRHRGAVVVAAALLSTAALAASAHAGANRELKPPAIRELAAFAAPGCDGGCGSGSTMGPDGALYVTDGKAGRVLRIDRESGDVSVVAGGLPRAIEAVGIGGAIDVAFIDHTAYVLVTLVGPFFGQADVVDGIYRIEPDGSATAVADIGTWSTLDPPATEFAVASGVQYALQPYRGSLLVTDGHHNRVLNVSPDGDVEETRAFGNIVPTGLESRGSTVYIGAAGPVPHAPEDGKVLAFGALTPVAEVASGAPLVVDVESGPGHELFALSQGVWDLPPDPENAGRPASPNTGSILRVRDGELTPVVSGLDRPTSLEFSGGTAFVTTLTGRVLRIDGVAAPPRR